MVDALWWSSGLQGFQGCGKGVESGKLSLPGDTQVRTLSLLNPNDVIIFEWIMMGM